MACGALLAIAACSTSSSGATDTPTTSPSSAATEAASASTAIPAAADGPSKSAQMICSTEARQAVATTLALPEAPVATPRWEDHLYSCTYALPSGSLVLSVKELSDVPAAQQYFHTLHEQIGPAEEILGVASLGLPGYQSEDGNVLFLKDAMTLQVDATALPAALGPHGLSRTDFAYQMATIILGCWTGD
jgi:hypothetical protein